MPDIAMCEGIECPWKNKCYRYTANPNEYRQAYFAEVPGTMLDELFSCEYFWPEEKKDISNEIKDICGP